MLAEPDGAVNENHSFWPAVEMSRFGTRAVRVEVLMSVLIDAAVEEVALDAPWLL